jgi:hypothetical protein
MTMTMAVADTGAVPADETSKTARRSTTTPAVVDAELVGRLVAQAREQGLQLSGEGGLLQQLTKIVLESALDDRASSRQAGTAGPWSACRGSSARPSGVPHPRRPGRTRHSRAGRSAPRCAQAGPCVQ